MRRRLTQVIAVMLLVSACTGTGGREQAAVRADADRDRYVEHRHDDLDLVTTTERYRSSQRRAHAHHRHEPTPDEVYAGQIALLLSAQVFACAFFVVILDGSCNFYASTGFYY